MAGRRRAGEPQLEPHQAVAAPQEALAVGGDLEPQPGVADRVGLAAAAGRGHRAAQRRSGESEIELIAGDEKQGGKKNREAEAEDQQDARAPARGGGRVFSSLRILASFSMMRSISAVGQIIARAAGKTQLKCG